MLKYLSKVLYIIPANKISLIILGIVFLLVSLLEVFGIGLIGPFIELASDPQSIRYKPWISYPYEIYRQIGLPEDLVTENRFLAFLGLFIIIIFCLKSFLSWKAQTYVFKFSFTQQGKIITKLMCSYLEAPYSFMLGKSSANVIQNIIDETRRFAGSVLSTFLKLTSDIIVVISLMLLLLKTDALAVIGILGILLPVLILFNSFKDKLGYWGKEGSQANEEIIRIVNHGLGGIKETKVLGCKQYFEDKVDFQAQRYAEACGGFYAFKLSPRIIIETTVVIFLVGFISLFLVIKKDGDLQDLTAVMSIFAVASFRLIPAASNLAGGLSILKNSTYTVDKLYYDLKEIEKVEAERTSARDNLSANGHLESQNSLQETSIKFNDKIVLDSLLYRYPNASENSLNGVSLPLKKGQSIALIGKSGAGKTTLVDVILGLLTPQSGDIQVDGYSIYKNLRSWQNLIGYIPQSIFLTDETIENNIAFGVPEELIDPERIEKAIQMAQLQEFIDELPEGVKTAVGERGVRLSGGQRQRIGIARALYHEKEILLLDEATAALDNETESRVTDAIKSLSGQKTMIIIAHRLTTIEHCDYIYLMDKGRIIQSGNYQEVVIANNL